MCEQHGGSQPHRARIRSSSVATEHRSPGGSQPRSAPAPSGASIAMDVGCYLWRTLPPKVRLALGWRTRADAAAAVSHHARTKNFVEFFCGTGGLVTAALSQGLRCSWYDVVVDSEHNLLTNKGFALAIKMVLSMIVGGCAWFGVPCRTFVWIARGHTRRSQAAPLGDSCRADVRQANLIVERVFVILRTLAMRRVHFIIEQPAGSLLWKMPKMRLAAKFAIGRKPWARRFVWLGHFGHRIAKPTELCGIFPGLSTAFPSKKPKRSNHSGVYKTWTDKRIQRSFARRWPPCCATTHERTPDCTGVGSQPLRAARWRSTS